MAILHGIAGEWARVRGMVFGLWPLFLCVFIGGFALALLVIHPLTGVLLLIAVIVALIVSTLRGFRHVERYFKGARGEERVSGILAGLPDDYHVFNDFAVGRHHVDHVLVGPAGVFAVETKFWNGEVTIEEGHVLVDGLLPSREPVPQAVKEATLVRNALVDAGWSGLVTPMVVFASDTFAARRAQIRGTVVMNASEITESFRTNRVVLSPEEIQRLVGLMGGIE